MNEILLNIISVVVTVIVIPLITLLGTKLIQWINSKVNNSTAAALLTTATSIVLSAVQSVFQTYVDSLKKSGTFDAEAQTIALTKAKDTALSQMTDDVKDYITKTYGDLDNWLTTQIESTINSLKK